MKRKEFLRTCGYGCLGLSGLSTLLQGCAPIQYVYAEPHNNTVKIPLLEFAETADTNTIKYIILKISGLLYPVVVYRLSNSNYTALLLQCTHRGTELNVNGNIITCSAHGSEFKNNGDVLHGPAEEPLQSFHITTDTNNLYIHLI